MSSSTSRKSMPVRNQRKKAVDGYNSISSGDSAPTTLPTTSPYYDNALQPISSYPPSPEQLLVTAEHPISLLSFLSVSSQTSENYFGWVPQLSTPYLSSYDVSSGSYPTPKPPISAIRKCSYRSAVTFSSPHFKSCGAMNELTIKQEETSMRPGVHSARYPLCHIDHGDLAFFPHFLSFPFLTTPRRYIYTHPGCFRESMFSIGFVGLLFPFALKEGFSSGVGLHSAFRYFLFGLI